jgi:hypothetical protein
MQGGGRSTLLRRFGARVRVPAARAQLSAGLVRAPRRRDHLEGDPGRGRRVGFANSSAAAAPRLVSVRPPAVVGGRGCLLWTFLYLMGRNLFAPARLLARPCRSKELEILPLRHEPAVLRRRGGRQRLTRAYRALLTEHRILDLQRPNRRASAEQPKKPPHSQISEEEQHRWIVRTAQIACESEFLRPTASPTGHPPAETG